MKCLQCGASMVAGREDFNYSASGLEDVTLQDIQIDRCPGCGDFEVVIPGLARLHSALAAAVAVKPEKLTPDEIRFLRGAMAIRLNKPCMTAAGVARRLRVTPQTLSRWESGAQKMGGVSELALRLLCMPEERVVWAVEHLDSLPAMSRGLQARFIDSRWVVEFERARPVREILGGFDIVDTLRGTFDQWDGAILLLYRSPAVGSSATASVASEIAGDILRRGPWTLDLGIFQCSLSRAQGAALATRFDEQEIYYQDHPTW